MNERHPVEDFLLEIFKSSAALESRRDENARAPNAAP